MITSTNVFLKIDQNQFSSFRLTCLKNEYHNIKFRMRSRDFHLMYTYIDNEIDHAEIKKKKPFSF